MEKSRVDKCLAGSYQLPGDRSHRQTDEQSDTSKFVGNTLPGSANCGVQPWWSLYRSYGLCKHFLIIHKNMNLQCQILKVLVTDIRMVTMMMVKVHA